MSLGVPPAPLSSAVAAAVAGHAGQAGRGPSAPSCIWTEVRACQQQPQALEEKHGFELTRSDGDRALLQQGGLGRNS